MAEVSPGACEQLHGRRAVQVDIPIVGKDELDESEGILGTGALANSDPAGDERLDRVRTGFNGTSSISFAARYVGSGVFRVRSRGARSKAGHPNTAGRSPT